MSCCVENSDLGRDGWPIQAIFWLEGGSSMAGIEFAACCPLRLDLAIAFTDEIDIKLTPPFESMSDYALIAVSPNQPRKQIGY